MSQLEKFEYDSYMREIVLCNVKFPMNDCVVIMKEDTVGIRVCVFNILFPSDVLLFKFFILKNFKHSEERTLIEEGGVGEREREKDTNMAKY